MNELINLLKKYVDTRTEIVKIEAQQEISRFVTRFFKLMILGFLGFLTLIFFALGVALFLNNLLETSMYVGFMIVSIIFMLFVIVLYQNFGKVSNIIRKYFHLTKSKPDND